MSKLSPTSQQVKILETLEQQIKVQTQTLEHLKSSNLAQKDAQKQIQAQSKAQTEKLIQERSEELKTLEQGWFSRIGPLEERATKLKDHLKKQVIEYDETRSKVVGAEAEAVKARDQLATIQSEVTRAQSNVGIQETKLVGIQAQIAELSGRIAPLQQEKIELIEETNRLRKQKEVAEDSLAGAKELMDEALLEHERALHNAKGELQKIRFQTQDDEHQWEVERKQMASRQTALDKREETLARREQKVTQGERDMSRNASLLQL